MATAAKTPPKQARSKAKVKPEIEPHFGDFPIETIAKRTQLDRAVVRKRLELHGYKPVDGHAKLKIFHFDEEMEAKLLETDTKLTEARIRQTLAAAEEKEFKVQLMKNEYAPVGEFVEAVQTVFQNVFVEVAVRMPKRLSSKLAKAKSASEVDAILSHEIKKIFNDVRENSEKYLATASAKRAA